MIDESSRLQIRPYLSRVPENPVVPCRDRLPTPTRSIQQHRLWSKFFDYLRDNPALLAAFDSTMKVHDGFPPTMIPVYPCAAELLRGSCESQDLVALVDVGGGYGHFLEGVLKACPDLSERIVLQDLQPTLDGIDPSSGLESETMAHDFFTPQPIFGKRILFLLLQSVLFSTRRT